MNISNNPYKRYSKNLNDDLNVWIMLYWYVQRVVKFILCPCYTIVKCES